MAEHLSYSRTYDRFPVTYPVIFSCAPFVGEGTVSNLSLNGCSVVCEQTITTGDYIKMRVLMPHPTAPLSIELGKVRWVHKNVFGIEFIRLPVIDRARLGLVVWERLTSSLEGPSYTVSQEERDPAPPPLR